MLTKRTSYAPLVWKQLNGIVSVFKPAGVKSSQVKYSVIGNLVRDLNQMKTRTPRKVLSINCDQHADSHAADSLLLPSGDQLTASVSPESAVEPAFRVRIESDLSDHVLAVGPRYQIEDVRCRVVSTLGEHTSGVLLLGLNGGTREAFRIGQAKLLRCYHVHGRFGIGTADNFPHSRIEARSSFGHIRPDKLGGLLASLQASHQQKMFELCGVDAQSQAAYELASAGPIRPSDNRMPLLYGLRCVRFAGAEFTIEAHALNENEAYFGELLREIGRQLHTVAHCTGIRCVQHGHFTADEALLRRRWTVQGIVDSLQRNRALLAKHPEMLQQSEAIVGSANGEEVRHLDEMGRNAFRV